MRAIVFAIQDPEPLGGEDVKITWRTMFYGPPLAEPNTELCEITVLTTDTNAQMRAAINAKIEEVRIALGYPALNRRPQNIAELFNSL